MTREQDTAKKIIEVLDYGTTQLDNSTAGKLAEARERALAAMARPAHVAHAETSVAGFGHFIAEHMHGPRAWMPMVLVAAALLIFVMLQQNSSREPVEGDALLLASDLPPEAYVDKGFDAWLENSSRH